MRGLRARTPQSTVLGRYQVVTLVLTGRGGATAAHEIRSASRFSAITHHFLSGGHSVLFPDQLHPSIAGAVGLRVWREKIPILPETLAFSRALEFDPLALIASGALLVVATPKTAPRLLRAYARQGIPAAVIGEIRPKREGCTLVGNGRETPLCVPKRDEIARLLG